MPIDATTSTQSMTSTQAAQSASVKQTVNTKSSDTSFQDEMTKVSESNKKEETKTTTNDKKETSDKNLKKDTEVKKEAVTSEVKTASETDKNKVSSNKNDNNELVKASLAFNQFALNDANNMLYNDIAQVIETNLNSNIMEHTSVWGITFGENSKANNNIAMNEADAQFFLNLTQDDNVSMQAITAQAQNMVNNGVDSAQVSQNFKVSQALLNALNESRQNNQPIRIDFDQNISVILRIGKDGAISANFIPGDKAVEQYLRNNIESLKNSFEEQDLNYAELTYSNSSKEQNHKRREEKRQGE